MNNAEPKKKKKKMKKSALLWIYDSDGARDSAKKTNAEDVLSTLPAFFLKEKGKYLEQDFCRPFIHIIPLLSSVSN